MSLPGGDSSLPSGRLSDPTAVKAQLSDPTAVKAQLSDPTAVNRADPFESTGHVTPARETQLSDPPTVIARRDNFVDLPPGSIVGEIYEIDAKIGAGGMGEVYAARHVRLGKRVAIKVIGERLSQDAGAIERFTAEAKALAQIQHPTIVTVEHVGELADGRAFFSMELLRGETLFARLQRGRIHLTEALRILDQVARGLEAAHAQGVTHRDLKPENIFLVHVPGEDPLVKIVDFGLLKLRADSDYRAERTQSGVAMGTPMYMSPEQARGQGVDHRTDIYAIGCIGYELLLGQPPFPHAKSAPELFAAHLHETPPLPRSIWPEIPLQLDLVLLAMIAKDPAYRPTLVQVRQVLAAARTTPSRVAETQFVAPHRPTRTGLLVGTALAVALVSGILIGVAVPARSAHVIIPTLHIDAGIQIADAPIVAPVPPHTDVASAPAPNIAPVPHPDVHHDAPRPVRRAPAPRPVLHTGGDPTPPPEPTPTVVPPPAIDRNQVANPFAHKVPAP